MLQLIYPYKCSRPHSNSNICAYRRESRLPRASRSGPLSRGFISKARSPSALSTRVWTTHDTEKVCMGGDDEGGKKGTERQKSG